jgi:hypothetical protein
MNLIIVPLMSAILGWLVAWLFIKAIFISWGGGLSKMISSIEIDKIITKEFSLQQFESALPLIDEQLDQFFKQRLGEKMPMISMFIGDKTVNELKAVFMDELKSLFPNLVHQFLLHAQQDFANTISNKWRPILEPQLLKATIKFRIIASILGLLWGIITILLIHLL